MRQRPATIRRILSLFLAVWFSLSPFLNELLKRANAAPVVGAPVVSTTVVQAGVSTRITVDCPITIGPGDAAIVSVQLQRVDGEGRLVKVLATLQGKPYGGQGLFNGHLTIKESTPGDMRLRCSVIFKNNPEPVVSPVTTISILPAAVNQPPFFTSTPVTTATKNVAYAYQATAQDPEKDKITFSLVSGPKGMKIGQTTGLVQWTPTQIGNQNVQLRVTDTKKASSTQSFTIRVGDGTVNQPPFFTSSPVTNATEGVAYSYQATAQDPENGALAFSLVSGPSGMTVGQTTGLV